MGVGPAGQHILAVAILGGLRLAQKRSRQFRVFAGLAHARLVKIALQRESVGPGVAIDAKAAGPWSPAVVGIGPIGELEVGGVGSLTPDAIIGVLIQLRAVAKRGL